MSIFPSRTGTEKTGSPGKAFGFKVLITMLLLTAGFVFLVIKLFEIQITDFKVYRQKVVDQLTYEGTIPSERGLIYSADGELLAANTVRYRIFIDPTAIQEEMAKIADGEESRVVCERPIDEEIADGLSVITGVSAEKILEMSRKLGRLDETVLRSADSELAGKVREYVSEHRFERLIYLEGTSERYYIYGDFASHLLGFTGRDGYGLYGLEYYYNEELTGTDGRFIAATDAGGRVLPYEYETRIPAENGKTGMQAQVQFFMQAHQGFHHALSAAAGDRQHDHAQTGKSGHGFMQFIGNGRAPFEQQRDLLFLEHFINRVFAYCT